jgi:hypothetical protein
MPLLLLFQSSKPANSDDEFCFNNVDTIIRKFSLATVSFPYVLSQN